jgi:hypothetical protein
MKNQHIYVYVVTGYQTSGQLQLPIMATASVVSSSVQRYQSTAHKLMRLKPLEIVLMDYLTEVMDDKNMVSNTAYHRAEFIDYVKKHCNKEVANSTVLKGFQSLKKLGLIISMDHRSYYRVNPRHYFAGSATARKALLKETYNDVMTKYHHKNNVDMVIGKTNLYFKK